MMSKSVYQQLFDDPQCQKLQPVTTNTVMHDHSKAAVLGSVTIPILKDNKKHGITFQVVPYEANTLLSCEQVTKHGLVIIPEQKQPPNNAIVYGSSVDIKIHQLPSEEQISDYHLEYCTQTTSHISR